MQELDKRLQAVASFVRPGSRVADIGTDHAYLPVWLVRQGICPAAIASDLNAGPLRTARGTVETAGLADRIALRLGNGLDTVHPGEVEDIVIAGMGGETIASILDAAPWVKDSGLRVILQPMTRAEDLRRWLLYNGFTVDRERYIQDGRRRYIVLLARYTDSMPPDDDLSVYAGFFSAEEGRPYREQMAAHLVRCAEGLARSGNTDEADRLRSLSARLLQL